MLFWLLLFPLVTTILLIGIDSLRGESIKLTAYLPHLAGSAVGGIFIGFIMYQVQKLKDGK